jgi:hypothetical protein
MAMPLPYNWFLPVDKSNSVAQVVPAANLASSFHYTKKRATHADGPFLCSQIFLSMLHDEQASRASLIGNHLEMVNP